MNKLRPFQEIGVDFLITRKESLLADEMGLGKTAQAIKACEILKAKEVLIICPASVKINWSREINKWYDSPYTYFIINSSKSDIFPFRIFISTIKSDKKPTTFYIVNYDLIIKDIVFKNLKNIKFDVLICDEAHYLKNMESKRTKKILGKGGLVHNATYKMMLTGTPILNRPIELYPMLKVLASELIYPYNNYFKFALRYCGAYYDNLGYFNDKGASNIPELKEKLDLFMLRRLKKDVAKELPAKTLQKIELLITPAIQAVINEENNMSITDKEDYIDNPLGRFSSLRRKTALAKLPQCIEFIKDVLENKEKIVIFAYHREVIDTLTKELNPYGVVRLIGGMTAEAKQKAIDMYIHTDFRIFIGQIQAAGQGIDGLQGATDYALFVESSWVPGEINQAVDRLHRMGQKNPVLAQFLVAEGTIESDMMDTVIKKSKIINQLIN